MKKVSKKRIENLWIRTKCLGIYFILGVPPIIIPYLLSTLRQNHPNEVSAFVINYCNLLYPIFFIAVFLITRLLSKKRAVGFGKFKYDFVLYALLYGQISFFIFLLFIDGLTFIRIFLLTVAIVFFILHIFRPSSNTLILCGIFYFVWSLLNFADFYFRRHLLEMAINYQTLCYWTVLPSLWLINSIFIIFILLRNYNDSILKNKIFTIDLVSSIRNAAGFAAVIVIFAFALIYQNIAYFTEGQVFEYSKKAVLNQWKRDFAKAFPGLPLYVYRNLAEQYENDLEKGISLHQDSLSGIMRYSISDDKKIGIGAVWAMFYQELFKKKGATHYRILKYDKATDLKDKYNGYKLLLYKLNGTEKAFQDSWRELIKFEKYDEKKCGLPLEEHILFLSKEMKYLESEPPLTISFDRIGKKEVVASFTISERYLIQIDSLFLYLGRSYCYLDNSIEKIANIIHTNFLNSFMDYLYFSISTIFTAGSGNITPIDPKVHLVTIIEITIGWFLLFVFGSCLIASISRR
jgi:hypothetical protein